MTLQEKKIKLASMKQKLEKAEIPIYFPAAQEFKLFKDAVLLTVEIVTEMELANVKD